MKRLILLLLFIPSVLFGQEDYQTIRSDMNAYYSNSKAIRIDSIKDVDGGKCYYSYNTLEYYDMYGDEDLYYDPYTNWIGGGVTILENGDNIFKDKYDQDIIINSKAELGDSWQMYEYSSGTKIRAFIISKEYQMIFDSIYDTVKVIEFQAYGANGIGTSHDINNDVYRLSKNYGLLDMPNIYNFYKSHGNPPSPNYFQLIGLEKDSIEVGKRNWINDIIGSLNVADEFQYHYSEGDYSYDINRTIITKDIVGESMRFTYYTCSNIQGHGYDTTNLYEESFDTILFPYNIMPYQIVFESEIHDRPFSFNVYREGQVDFCSDLHHFDWEYKMGTHYPVIYDDKPMWKFDVGDGGHFAHAFRWTENLGWYTYGRGAYDSPDEPEYYQNAESECGEPHEFACAHSGVHTLHSTEISILPNPNNGVFLISSSKKIDKLKVFNSKGQLISNIIIGFYDKQIDLSTEPQGIYYLQIQLRSGELINKKIVITAQ